MTFALGPFFTASSEAFTADDDLFNDREDAEELNVMADPDALLKLNPEIKATVQTQQIQTGLRLVDELRADDGLGPLPPVPIDWRLEPGKVPQITPVGGAENPTSTGPELDPTVQ